MGEQEKVVWERLEDRRRTRFGEGEVGGEEKWRDQILLRGTMFALGTAMYRQAVMMAPFSKRLLGRSSLAPPGAA